jgi:hypothetical protein
MNVVLKAYKFKWSRPNWDLLYCSVITFNNFFDWPPIQLLNLIHFNQKLEILNLKGYLST